MKKNINEIGNTLQGQKALSAVLGRAQERRNEALGNNDEEGARKYNKTCTDAEQKLVDGMMDLNKKGVSSKDISDAQMQGLRHGRRKHYMKESFGDSDYAISERAEEIIRDAYDFGQIEEGDTWEDVMAEGRYSDMYQAAENLSEEFDINVDMALNYLQKAFNNYEDLYESKNMKKKSTMKLNESELQKMISESVKKHLNEFYSTDDAGDMMGMEDGYDGPTNEPDYEEEDYFDPIDYKLDYVFAPIDSELSKLGDVFISRFYSDESNAVVAVNKELYPEVKEEVKNIMSGFNYKLYDIGSSESYAMMTFKPDMGMQESKNSKKKRNKMGSIQWNGSRTDAEEDGVDRYGNPMFKIKDKNGKTMRVQSFSFRPKISENTLKQIVGESVKRVLKEGMTSDNPYYEKWETIEEQLGPEQMLLDIFNYLDSSQLEQIINWFDQDYDFFSEEENEELEDEDYPDKDDLPSPGGYIA